MPTSEYEMRTATEEDVDFLSTRLRPIDLKEISAMSGRSARASMMSGLKMSEVCKVGVADGEPFCIYGVRRLSALSDKGSIWLLATDDLPKHAMKFGRKCIGEVEAMLVGFEIVENWCHVENKQTIRWLKWMGFQFNEAESVGRNGELFHRFYMRGA